MSLFLSSQPKYDRLLSLTIFCLALLGLRVYLTANFTFCFLLWNLFLAWIPWLMAKQLHRVKNNFHRALACLPVILFLPNAPYIVTDLFHLQKELAAPLWLDVMIISSFALGGLICFTRTIKLLQNQLHSFVRSHSIRETILVLFMFLNAYGIYLGRYLRYNSWDLFIAPLDLIKGMYSSVASHSLRMDTLGVTLSYGLFLYLLQKQFSQAQGPPLAHPGAGN